VNGRGWWGQRCGGPTTTTTTTTKPTAAAATAATAAAVVVAVVIRVDARPRKAILGHGHVPLLLHRRRVHKCLALATRATHAAPPPTSALQYGS